MKAKAIAINVSPDRGKRLLLIYILPLISSESSKWRKYLRCRMH